MKTNVFTLFYYAIVFHAAHEMALHRVVELAPEEGRAFVYEMYKHLAGNDSSNITLACQDKGTVLLSSTENGESICFHHFYLLYSFINSLISFSAASISAKNSDAGIRIAP